MEYIPRQYSASSGETPTYMLFCTFNLWLVQKDLTITTSGNEAETSERKAPTQRDHMIQLLFRGAHVESQLWKKLTTNDTQWGKLYKFAY